MKTVRVLPLPLYSLTNQPKESMQAAGAFRPSILNILASSAPDATGASRGG
jgi:hypothetical protein